jgi:hypothetical protein
LYLSELPCEIACVVSGVFARRRLLRIRDVLNEGCGDAFFVRQRARQVTREMTYLVCQRGFALCIEGVGDVEPTVGDLLVGLKQFGSRWLKE